MEDILKEVGINRRGNYSSRGAYIVDLDSFDDIGRYQSILDRNDDVEEMEDNSMLNTHTLSLLYKYGEYTINLKADLDSDKNQIVVTKN